MPTENEAHALRSTGPRAVGGIAEPEHCGKLPRHDGHQAVSTIAEGWGEVNGPLAAAARLLVINAVTGLASAVVGVTAGYLLGTGGEEFFGDMARLEWLALVAVIAVLGWRRLRRASAPANPCT